jgi:Grx4 family monothiol glutaredoxin
LAAEKCPETFQKYGVETVPTVLFTQTDKKILAKLSSEITPADVLDKLATEADKFKETFEKERSKWHPKIESILSSCPIIIFIKGTPQTPKCGFTEQLLDILNKHSV